MTKENNKMKKNLIISVLLIGMFLLSFANAAQFDNVKEKNWNKELKQDFKTDKLDLKYNTLWDKYEPITVENTFGLGKTLFEGAITEHTEVCEYDYCYSIMEIYTSGDDAVIDDIIFKTEQEDGSWVEQDVRSYKLQYWGDIDDYEYQCVDSGETSKNGTKIQSCSNVKTGSHEGYKTLGLGEVLPAGNYKIKLEAWKKPSRTVDWIIETNGKFLNEWAVWGGSPYLWVNGSLDTTHDPNGITNPTYFFDSDNTTYAEKTGNEIKTILGKNFTLSQYINKVFINVSARASHSGGRYAWIRIKLEDKIGTVYDQWYQEWGSTTAGILSIQEYVEINETIDGLWINITKYHGSGLDINSYSRYNTLEYSIEGGGQTTLNSPADSSISNTNNVQFNTTATVTGGATLVNMSLWTNETGSWTEYNSTSISEGDYTTVANDYIAFYPLDLLTGDVEDLTDNYNASNSGASRGAVGQINNSFELTSVDYIDLPDSLMNSEMTVTSWIYWDGGGGDNVIFSNFPTAAWAGGAMQTAVNSGEFKFLLHDGSNIREAVSTDTPISSNTWHFVVATFNGTQMEIFVDGSSKDTYDTTSPMTGYHQVIGGRKTPLISESYFGGRVDEVGFWDRALTSGEITSLWNSGDGTSYKGSASSTQTWNRTITDSIIWNVQACDTDGDCGFATSNFSLSLDTTAPTIEILSPITVIDSLTPGENVTLNYSITDTNLDSCWYEYNGTNTTTPCSTNSSFIYELDEYTIILWANDTVSNVGSETITLAPLISVTNETYSDTSYDTTIEEFEIFFDYNSSVYLSLTANIVYNGTNYTGTVTTGDNSAVVNRSVSIPSVPATTDLEFYWEIYLNDGSTIYVVQSSHHNQTVSPLPGINITTDECSAGTFKSLYYDFKDAENLTSMNASIAYNFKFGISSLQNKTVNGEITNTPSFHICINNTISDYKLGYGEIEYVNTGYSSRRYYMYEGQELSNETQANHTLHLLPSASSTSFIFEFKNTFLNPYTNKLVALLRWYPEEDEYRIVEMAKTDDDGSTVMKVHTEDIDYRVGLYDLDGTLLKLADPVRMACLVNPCTYTLKVIHDPIDFDELYNIETSLTWDKDNDRFVFIYNDPSQQTSQMRLHVYRDAGFQEILICNDTASGYTGVLTCGIGNETGRIIAKAYRSASPEWPISIAYHSIRDAVESSFGLFTSFLIVLVSALIGVFSPIASIFLLLVGLIISVFLGSVTFAVAMGLGVLGGIIINVIKNYS